LASLAGEGSTDEQMLFTYRIFNSFLWLLAAGDQRDGAVRPETR
jgi:hypothetical protein